MVRLEKAQAGEYAYPRRRYAEDSTEYEGKMRAAPELDHLLEIVEYSHWANDTSGHPEATLGFDYYNVKFIVGNHLFEGLVNIANSEKGRIFYDITKVKEISDTSGKYATLMARPASAFGNPFGDSVSQTEGNVKPKSSQDLDDIQSLRRENEKLKEQVEYWKQQAAPAWKSAGQDGEAPEPGVPEQIGTTDFADRQAVLKRLDLAQKETEGLDHEVNYSVTTDGIVWRVSGETGTVNPSDIPSSLAGFYSFHNHPKAKTWFSFSAADVRFFFQSGEQYAKAADHLYEYIMERTKETVDIDPDVAYRRFEEIMKFDVFRLSDQGKINVDIDGFHEVMKRLSAEFHFVYGRRKVDGN